MRSLEPLSVNSTAQATRCCQRGGLGLAVGTHRLGHCRSGVALEVGEEAGGRKLTGLADEDDGVRMKAVNK